MKKGLSFKGRDKLVVAISVLVIAVAGTAVYLNSLSGEFVWDDEVLIKGNVYIKSWSNLTKIFSQDIGGGAARKYGYYRPLQILTYMVDHALWRLDVRGYHLTNIFLHVLAAIALYWWISLTFQDRLMSFFAGILFVLHPVHTEAVAYISGRSDSLALLFLLLGLIFYDKSHSRRNPWFPVLALLTWAGAILSRETSLILPALLVLYHYAFKKPYRPELLLPLLGMILAYVIFRTTALRHLLPHTTSSSTFFQRLPGFFAAFYYYLRLLLVPVHLHMEYGNGLFGFANLKVISGLLLFLFLMTAALKRKGDKLTFFSLSWFLLTLLPVSNLYPLNAYMAEHWLYLPSVGFFMLAAGGLSRWYRTKRFRIGAAIVVAGLVLAYSFLTLKQNRYWRRRVGFYERTLKYSPESLRVLNNLGLAYHVLGRHEEAIRRYQDVLRVKPGYFEAYNNLGSAYRALGKREEAIAAYQRTIELKPGFAEAYYNLGTVYQSLGRPEEAASLFKRATELNPNYAGAYNDLAVLHSLAGRTEEAIALFRKAIAVDSDFAGAYNNLANILYRSGRKEEAREWYRKAILLQPEFPEAYYNLGRICRDLGRSKEAIASFKKAVEIRPGFARAHRDLARMYYDTKQYDLAIQHCDRTLALGHRVDPGFLKLLDPYR